MVLSGLSIKWGYSLSAYTTFVIIHGAYKYCLYLEVGNPLLQTCNPGNRWVSISMKLPHENLFQHYTGKGNVFLSTEPAS